MVLPLTGSDRVALLDSGSLEEVGSVGTAPAPSWVAVEEPSTSLFALSEDGSTVTVVDYDLLTEKFRLEVRGGPEAAVEPGDDIDPSFWLVTPDGVTYFSEAERPEPVAARQVPLSHKTFSPDDDSEVAERNDLGETVEHVEALPDEQRVHAVTANEVITMRFGTLETVKTTEFRSTLERAGLGDARISDFIVGADHLYLAVEGEPYLEYCRSWTSPMVTSRSGPAVSPPPHASASGTMTSAPIAANPATPRLTISVRTPWVLTYPGAPPVNPHCMSALRRLARGPCEHREWGAEGIGDRRNPPVQHVFGHA